MDHPARFATAASAGVEHWELFSMVMPDSPAWGSADSHGAGAEGPLASGRAANDLGLHSTMAEQEAMANVQRFRDCAAAGSVWFWETGSDQRFTWFSDNAEALCGLAITYMLGKSRRELGFAEDPLDHWSGHLGDLAENRPFRNFRYRARLGDGTVAWFSISGVPYFAANGSFLGHRGTGTNVTAEVLAEERAEKAQDRLNDAIESIADGFVIFDAQDRLVLANTSYRQALACIGDLLEPGAAFPDLLRALVDREHVALPNAERDRWLREQLKTRRSGPAVRTFQTNQGRWIQVREYRARDGGRVMIRTDQTQQMQAELALRESRASLANAQRIARLGSWDLNVRSTAMVWSEELHRILGLSAEVGPSYDQFLRMVHEDDREMVDTAIGAAPTAGGQFEIEHRIRWPDGRVRTVLHAGEVTFDATGEAETLSGTVQDVTEKRAAEERISEIEERFRRSFQLSADALSISRLHDGIFVDVNEAFTEILGYSRAEVLGRSGHQLDLWMEPLQHLDMVARLEQSPIVRNLPMTLRRRTGEPCAAVLSASVCAVGGVPHVFASLRDIGEQQRIEIELRQLWCAVEQSSSAVIITNPQGNIEYVNPAFTAITGYDRQDVVGRNPRVLRSQNTSAAEYRHLWETITSGEAWQGEFYNRRKDGSHYWGGATISPVKAPDGSITHFIGIQADITLRKQAEQELKASEERFRSLVESALLGICIERDSEPLFVNQTFAEIFGYASSAEVIALGSTRPLFPASERARAAQIFEVRRQGGRVPAQYEIRGLRKDGEAIWLQAQTKPIPWQGGTALQSTVVDITLRKRYEERLHHQANYDAITELPNRTLALDRVNRALMAAHRRERRVALLFVDVDHFKKINDTLGHAVGDRFLQEMARRLRLAVRQEDTVARLGGDEFLVLLPEIRESTDAEMVAGRIIQAVSQPFVLDGQEAFVTVSIGVATYPEDGSDVESLMRHADAAMYVAKESGRNTLRFVTAELREHNRYRIQLEAELRHAIERDQLSLHYQPLIDLHSGRIQGAEALLRWTSPEYGPIGPDRVVRLAEETGLIVPIGEWVLKTGCRELRRWIDAGHSGMGLSVNVSSRQFRSDVLADVVRGALDHNRLDPACLELEITESLLLEDLREVTATLQQLVACGIRLAVDDFGTGYSSLSYLTRFPLHTLKIDRSFVAGLSTGEGPATLVDALIALAHRLGLRVVAEGLETEDQLAFLRARNCDLAQGYHFSQPLPADAFLTLLGDWTAAAPG